MPKMLTPSQQGRQEKIAKVIAMFQSLYPQQTESKDMAYAMIAVELKIGKRSVQTYLKQAGLI